MDTSRTGFQGPAEQTGRESRRVK